MEKSEHRRTPVESAEDLGYLAGVSPDTRDVPSGERQSAKIPSYSDKESAALEAMEWRQVVGAWFRDLWKTHPDKKKELAKGFRKGLRELKVRSEVSEKEADVDVGF